MFAQTLKLIRHNLLIIMIVSLATLLRTWDIDTKAIFFGDAAHDLGVAFQAVEERRLPLLGIESSVPRFHQGPVTIWLEMMIRVFFGQSILAQSLIFAIISVLGIMATYEYMTLYGNKKGTTTSGTILATIMIAISPLAIAHGRMIYHTTALPLMMVLYLFALMRLHEQKKWGIGVAVLAWCGVFQFELATFPLLFLIPYVWWKTHTAFKPRLVAEAVVGGVIGLFPQLIYDVTHRFTHAGGFLVWVVYRSVGFLGASEQHAISFTKFATTWQQFWLYGGRIFGVDRPGIAGIAFIILGLSLITLVMRWRRRQLLPGQEYTLLATLLLLVAYIVHGSPSEAYFPPFFVLWPMVLGFTFDLLAETPKKVVVAIVLLLTILNITDIVRASFFTSTTHSFNYGPSIGEQRQIITVLKNQHPQGFSLATTNEGGKFEKYFANLRLLAQAAGAHVSDHGPKVFVESKNSPLGAYPGMKKVSLPTVDIYLLP